MFTTLSTVPPSRRICRRKILTEEIPYKDNCFYTSKLISRKKDNRAFIAKYKRECRVPVIEETDEIVLQLKYHILLSSVFDFLKSDANIFVYDPKGTLTFLLPRIVSKAKTVYVYTLCEDYSALNELILAQIGAAAVISTTPPKYKRYSACFAATSPHFSVGCPVFGQENWFVEDCTPNFGSSLSSPLASYVSIYCVAAGLWQYMGEKRIIFGKCNALKFRTEKTDIYNIMNP